LFIGAEIEYSGAVYTRVGISNFAVLKDGYTGWLEELEWTSQWLLWHGSILYRYKTRSNKRQAGNAGLEAGIDFKITDNLL
jgi:hypothetical protein